MQGMAGDSEEDKEVKQAQAEVAEAGPEALLADFNIPMQSLQVWRFKEPANAVAAQLKLYQALKPGGSYQTALLKEKPEVKANAQEHGGFKLHEVSVRWDFEKTAEKLKAPKEMADALQKIMGEGLQFWFGTDGKVVVNVFAKGWDEARNQLDDFLEGRNTIGQQKAFAAARKQLPDQTTVLAIIDPLVYAQAIAEYAKTLLPQFPIPEVKAEKGKCYLGVAVALHPQRGAFDLWLPGTAISEIKKMVEPVIPQAKLNQ
jgi:hypothetical protein